MKATGIVRRIDDLGRVVIPKEIRRTMRLREGEPLEIYTERAGEIILKKYSPIADLAEYAQHYADALFQSTASMCCITDRDTIIAAAGLSKKDYLDKKITDKLDNTIKLRKTFISSETESPFPITADVGADESSVQIVAPIVADGDIVGAVILFMVDKIAAAAAGKMTAQTGAAFLGKMLE